jgi:hypothetical protein
MQGYTAVMALRLLARLFLLNVSQCVGVDPQPATEDIGLLILEKEKFIYAPVLPIYLHYYRSNSFDGD